MYSKQFLAASVDVKKLSITESFKVQPDQLWKVLTDPEVSISCYFCTSKH